MNLSILNSAMDGTRPLPALAPHDNAPASKIVPFPGLKLKNGSVSVRQLSSDGSNEKTGEEADIDIWVIPDASMEPLLEAETVLSAQERRHANRYKSEKERTRYIAVRTLLRLALSHRMRNAVAGGDWRFSMNAYGKPELCPEQANCSFSISHADGFSVVAIAPNTTVGVDAEKIDRERIKHLPLECLSSNEQDRLNARPQDDRHYDFFRLWTLKEAYTKALGEGLSRDFGELEFNLDTVPDAPAPGPDAADDENYELLTLKYFEFNHLLAICLLDVAGGGEAQPTKNLYLVEASTAEARGAGSHHQTPSEDHAMHPYLQIIDQANPERIELYAFGDLLPLLHEIIDTRAEHTPHHTALEVGGRKVSYHELARASNAVANYLIGRGMTQGEFVALYQEKTADLIISLLGVLKAGGAYVPIDPKRAPADAARIVDAYGARFVLTTSGLSGKLETEESVSHVLVDEERASFDVLASQEGFLNAIEIPSDAVSHVTFTPEAPDGVTVDNREAVNFVRSLIPVYGLDAGHRCCQDPALAIDVALEEICAMLSAGSTVVLAEPAASPEATAKFMSDRKITLLSTVPEVLGKIEGDLPTIDVLIVGGERCSSDLAVKWALRTQRLVSLKRPDDRFPSFSIERESRAPSRPRLLFPRASDRATA